MAMTIHVDIVSAENAIFSGLAEMVVVPAAEGELGVVARHAPLLSRLKPGEVRVKISDKETLPFYVSGGVVEVQPHLVTVLADTAIRASDIDEAAVQEARRQAEEMMADSKDKIDFAKAQARLVEAMAQLRTLEKYRKSGI